MSQTPIICMQAETGSVQELDYTAHISQGLRFVVLSYLICVRSLKSRFISAVRKKLRDLAEYSRLQRKAVFFDHIPGLQLGAVENFTAGSHKMRVATLVLALSRLWMRGCSLRGMYRPTERKNRYFCCGANGHRTGICARF
ncbi:hypothetical protein BFP70_05005 [Thioclava sp. SK-1]|nr:hypothetical protein BFP70_05005 [Thioclava sp. SK-1]